MGLRHHLAHSFYIKCSLYETYLAIKGIVPEMVENQAKSWRETAVWNYTNSQTKKYVFYWAGLKDNLKASGFFK
jgi:hypothetical protein